jgi:hypothetical protein
LYAVFSLPKALPLGLIKLPLCGGMFLVNSLAAGQTHIFSTIILWAKPCGLGYPHSLFVKKTKELKQMLLSLLRAESPLLIQPDGEASGWDVD